MCADGELGPFGQILNEGLYRAVAEFDDRCATTTDEMVPVSGVSHDVCRETARFEEAMHHVDRREDLQRSVDGRSPDVGQEMDDLLGREWPVLIEDCGHDFAPGACGSVSEFHEPIED
jgi:hypothetical protein